MAFSKELFSVPRPRGGGGSQVKEEGLPWAQGKESSKPGDESALSIL